MANDDEGLPPGQGGAAASHSVLSGTAGNAIVAGAISGDVHFHESAQRNHRPWQVPRTIGTFVNRIADLEKLTQVTRLTAREEFEHSIVLITGTAGVGKTSLAVRWADGKKDLFPDGQLYINLRGFDPAEPIDPIDAVTRFLTALGVPAGGIPNDLDAAAAELRTQLVGRRMLLLLDNAATVDQVRPLLPAQHQCLTLVTSRNSLPKLVSEDGARRIDLKLFTADDSVSLLKAILSLARTGDDDENLAELANLCARLPLALRVAAQRAIERPRDSVLELIEELRGEALWDSLSTDDSEHADAIRSVFAWSYRALAQSAARMFRLLGLHPGQEISAAAAAALAGLPIELARNELRRLESAHMIESLGGDRYQMHDLLRAYAVEQVSEEPEAERADAIDREAAWYTHTAAAAVAKVQEFHEPADLDPVPARCTPLDFKSAASAVEWYEQERANLRSISAVAVRYGHRRWAWQLAIALYPIHHAIKSSFRDWLVMADAGLAAARLDGELSAVAEILTSRGVALEKPPRQLDRAARDLGEALWVWRSLDDRTSEIRCLNSMGWVAFRRRSLAEAARHFEQVSELAEQLEPGRWRAVGPENGCVARYERGDLDIAAELGNRALDVLRELAANNGIAIDLRVEFDILTWLAKTERERGLLTEATQISNRMAEITEAQGSPSGYLMLTRLEQGRLELALGDTTEARNAFNDAQREFGSERDQVGEGEALVGIGDVHLALDRRAEARQFYEAAADVFTRAAEPWLTGSTLAKLASALAADGQADRAQAQRDAALRLIEPYDDPRTVALRRALSDPTSRTGA